MNFRTLVYVKKQVLSRFLAKRISGNRTFTALQLILKTLRANKMLPERLVALELFGFIGTTGTMDYANLCDYLEMWEIDPYYAKHAEKNVPNAVVVCGDSINAIKTGKVLRKEYNFIVIDANSHSAFGDGNYESFGVFHHALNYIAKEAVILVAIFSDLNNLAKTYNTKVEDLDQNWIAARKEFFEMDNVINGRGIDYLKKYEKIVREKNIELIHSQFINRNDSVAFGVFVVKKN